MTDTLPQDDAPRETLPWWLYPLAPVLWLLGKAAELGQRAIGGGPAMFPRSVGACFGIMVLLVLIDVIAIVIWNGL